MFKVTIINIDTEKTVNSKEFGTKKDANRFKRELINSNELIKHAGHIVNYSKRIELITNY